MVILGLGSNTGDRRGYLRAAVRSLSALLTDMRLSTVVETPAMLPPGGEIKTDSPYLNMAVAGTTDLTPRALFAEIKMIEKRLGRIPRGFWCAREIDIDILAMGTLVLEDDDLIIPHAGLLKRNFVLLPLAELDPRWRYPVHGLYYNQPVANIVAALGYKVGKSLTDTGMLSGD